MRYPLCCLLLFLCVLGCQTDSKLTVETRNLNVPTCDDCARFEIKFPYVINKLKIANTINTAIEEEIIYTLQFNETDAVTTAEGAASSFNKSFQQMVSEFGTFAQPWEATIDGALTYEGEELVTIALEMGTYTGGAHGYYSKVLLNFDKNSGKELEVYELFRDMEGFLFLAEARFRETYEMPKTGNINATGFMFSDDMYVLPENIGFMPEGLELHYNQYEVSSYADGPLIVSIPYKDVNPFLRETYQIKGL